MITIRPASPTDCELVETLSAELPDDCAHAAGWLDEPAVFGIVAELDGEPVGFALVALVEDRWRPGAELCSTVGEVAALAVSPTSRGRGAGRALLRTATEFSLVSGCRTVAANCSENNLAIQALLAELGFRPTTIEGSYPDGQRAVRVELAGG